MKRNEKLKQKFQNNKAKEKNDPEKNSSIKRKHRTIIVYILGILIIGATNSPAICYLFIPLAAAGINKGLG